MYQSHWGLRETPFPTNLDPKLFFASGVHEEALARLHYLVENQRRLGLLLGGPGSGKSLLLRVFAAELSRCCGAVARLNLAGVTADEFPALLSGELGLPAGRNRSHVMIWRRLADQIAAARYDDSKIVILLDDADLAEEGVLEAALRVACIDPSPSARHTLVLAASAAQFGKLQPRLLDMAELRIDLNSWLASDTASHIDAALARAGRAEPVFDPVALEKIHELSQGVPRRVNRLADLALLAGAGAEMSQVDAGTIESVHQELEVCG